jgi:hypothetical protein
MELSEDVLAFRDILATHALVGRPARREVRTAAWDDPLLHESRKDEPRFTNESRPGTIPAR